MNEPHCETCTCGKRAPVQASRAYNNGSRQALVKGPGSVAWDEHVLAWSDYAARYGRDQTAERLAERGGFSWLELVDHLGREPTTWKPADR